MKHAKKIVTIYHKSWDATSGVDIYNGEVINGVSFFSRVATTPTTDGLAAACEATLRIPTGAVVGDIAPGDLVCEGSLQTEGVRPSDLDGLCPYVYTVVGVTHNTAGREPHVKVVCK